MNKWLKRLIVAGAIMLALIAAMTISFFRITSIVEGIRVDQEVEGDITKPSLCEVRWHVYSAETVMRLFYKDYSYRLGLKGNETVLDFGSGAGGEAMYLAEALSKSGGTLTCLDISSTWLQAVQRRLAGFRNVDYKLGDVTAMNLNNNSYDVIVVHLVMHDVSPSDRPAIAKSLARLLKPGGRLCFREPFGEEYSLGVEGLKGLFREAGLVERRFEYVNPLLVWPMCEGEYYRPL